MEIKTIIPPSDNGKQDARVQAVRRVVVTTAMIFEADQPGKTHGRCKKKDVLIWAFCLQAGDAWGEFCTQFTCFTGKKIQILDIYI
jgi:hypothetical protein